MTTFTSSGSSTPTSSVSSAWDGMPRLGGIRCYWALCAPQFADPSTGTPFDMVFVYTDPVFSVHLSRQRLSLLGRGVMEFIHPGEREQARRDLSQVIATDDIQGSVTRVRFSRLTRIRRLLGGTPEEVPAIHDAATFALDEEYLILDLVINWVADGLLLVFFHAVQDKDPVANNDPRRKYEEWTNFCGTVKMGEDQIDMLHSAISACIPPPTLNQYPPTRVFQLHTSADAPVRPGELVFSWPPPRPPGVFTRNDGRYDANEYVGLMRGVNFRQAEHAPSGETRTNCTTRFGAQHSITTEGVYRHVSSVFIPYGTLVFACFHTTKMVPFQRASISQGIDYQLNGAPREQSYVYSDQWTTDTWPPRPPLESAQPALLPPPPPPPPLPPAADPPLSYPPPGTPLTAQNGYRPPDPSPPKPQTSPGLSGPTTNGSAANSGSSRQLVRPPGNVECCRICGLRESPEWRRSESGVKDLCNACGLRLARQVAKREGRQKPRRKKEK